MQKCKRCLLAGLEWKGFTSPRRADRSQTVPCFTLVVVCTRAVDFGQSDPRLHRECH